MWEYKIDYVAIWPPNFAPERDDWDNALLPKEERARYGDFCWQKAIVEQLSEFGKQGWEVVSIPERLLEGKGLDGFVLLKRLKQKE